MFKKMGALIIRRKKYLGMGMEICGGGTKHFFNIISGRVENLFPTGQGWS